MELNDSIKSEHLYFECTAQNCIFSYFPKELAKICSSKTICVYCGNYKFKLISEDLYTEIMDTLDILGNPNAFSTAISNNSEMIFTERNLFLSIFHACKRENISLSGNAVFKLAFSIFNDSVNITVMNIDDLQNSKNNDRIIKMSDYKHNG